MPLEIINGHPTHFHIAGQGEPVLFIHPPLLTSSVFDYQKQVLPTKNVQVITMDLRGHGQTPASATPITYTLFAEDIKQLCDRLSLKKPFLCGYSTGGSIVLEMLLTYPGRFAGGILISAMPEVSDIWLKSRIRLAKWLTRWKAKTIMNSAISLGNSDSRFTFANLFRNASEGSVRNWMEYYHCSLTYNCTARLASIKEPLLLIFGSKDKGFHRYAKLLMDNLPNADLFLVDGGTHQLPTKAPDPTNTLILQWLERQAVDALEATEPEVSPPWMTEEILGQEDHLHR